MSVQLTDCYDYIIGLYSGDCDCYDGRPVDYNVSDSGLYLSDVLELSFIDALLTCEQGASVWDLMQIVRNYAIKLFIADTNAMLMQFNKLRRLPFKGGVGRHKYTATKQLVAGHYAGVRMYCADVVSGYMKINKIGCIFDTTGTIDLLIYDNNGTLIDTLTLDTTANSHEVNILPVPIELPMHDDYIDNLEYFFLYQVGGILPKNNDLSCNCEHWTPCFDKGKPYWGESRSNARNGWASYVMVGGTDTSSLPDFMNSTQTTSNQMYGLTFEVEFGCNVGEVLCKDELDYVGNTLAQAIAIAVQHKAAALFMNKLISSPVLNRFVMLDKEDMLRRRDEFEQIYKEQVEYIAKNTDIRVNDCLECKDFIEMTKKKILV